jgi:hypothetical protein
MKPRSNVTMPLLVSAGSDPSTYIYLGIIYHKLAEVLMVLILV